MLALLGVAAAMEKGTEVGMHLRKW